MAGEGETLGGGLAYEDRLRLRWAPRAPADGSETARHHEANEEFLRAMAVLETHPEFDEERSSVAQALARLDLKIGLLAELVGRMLARQLALPEPVPVRLTTRSIEWRGTELPAPGTEVEVELYLRPEYPFPLVLPGRAVETGATPGAVRVALEALSEPVQEWLERTIFRHHRRAIALSRRSTNRDEPRE